MKLFACQHCNNAIHFDNTACVNCNHRLGYLPSRFNMTAVESNGDALCALGDSTRPYLFCENAKFDACNWLVSLDDGCRFCIACRHNRTIPDLSLPMNIAKWRKLELAKRYMVYSLMRWGLPLPNRDEDPQEGLAFDFLGDRRLQDGSFERVLTGHEHGVITINIAEADDAERENRRGMMGEPYRTVLGHFRHEIGHYYWDRLVGNGPQLARFRELFGDEREDYSQALARHYEGGAPANWQASFISGYAASHPWEDFAETWAHNLHMVDSLETAAAFSLTAQAPIGVEPKAVTASIEAYAERSAERLAASWAPMTIMINSINRSMGQPDLYPFVLSAAVIAKLQFINDLVHSKTI